MNLNPALAAVVADLTPRFPDLRDVAVHGGAFTERELVLWLDRVPGLRVGVLGLNGIQPRGRDGWQADLRWTAYVFTTDTATTDRLTLAVNTVETYTGGDLNALLEAAIQRTGGLYNRSTDQINLIDAARAGFAQTGKTYTLDLTVGSNKLTTLTNQDPQQFINALLAALGLAQGSST